MDWLGKTGEVLRSAIAHLEAEQEEGKEAAAAAEEEIELWLLSETEQSEVTALKKLREQISDPEEAVDQDNDTVLWLLSPAAYRNALISDIVAGRAPLSVDDLSNVERLEEEIAKLEALAEERPLSDMETWELGFLLDQLEFARLEERDRADAQGPAAPPIAPLPTIEVGAGDDQVQEAGGDPLELS